MNLEQLIKRQQEILEAAKKDGNRSLSVEEQREFDVLQGQIDTLRAAGNQKHNPNPPSQEDNQRAIEMERQRVGDITDLFRKFDEDPTEFIRNGKTVDEARQFILEKQLENRKPGAAGVHVGDSEYDKFRAAAVDGLSLRVGMGPDKPAEGARDLRSMSLRELAKESLRIEGHNNAYRYSDDEMLRQYLTPSSLFTGIIDLTARQVFEKAYTASQTTYQEWVKTGTLKDFRPTKTYQVGTAGELLLVPENGELKHDMPLAEEGPVRQLLTYGRQFTMSRQMFINDDVDFISTIPALYAQSARQGINRLVYQLLASNPAIWDGKTLFHADHKNIATGGAPSVATLSQARRLMKSQKAAGGDVKLNLPARFMIVPTALETAAGQLIGSSIDPTATISGVNNPFYNQFTIISDAELDDLNPNGESEWYLTADKMRSPIQVDFLNGVDMPTIAMKQAPAGQLGFVWDIYMDYGVSIVDYKTVVKNPGQ